MEAFQPWHIILIVLVAVIFFGGRKLPELGKGLGEGFKGFKDGLKGVTDDTPESSNQAKAKPVNDAHIVTPVTPEEPVKR